MGLSLFWVDFDSGSISRKMVFSSDPGANIDSLMCRIEKVRERREASKYFAALGSAGPASVDPMIGLLNHEWSVNREFAAYELGKLKTASAINPLIQALKDPEGRVRSQAVWSLGHIGSETCVDDLLSCLNQDTLPISRSTVYTALGEIRSGKSWDVLVGGLEDEEWWSRISALGALYLIDSEKSLQ